MCYENRPFRALLLDKHKYLVCVQEGAYGVVYTVQCVLSIIFSSVCIIAYIVLCSGYCAVFTGQCVYIVSVMSTQIKIFEFSLKICYELYTL